MTEVRTIERREAESFLRLLCDVFELEYARAVSIFYSEPLFDLNRKWALLEKGRIVSILTTVPLEFGWGKGVGIAGVATAPDCQRRGYAARLLKEVIQASERKHEGALLLFAKDRRLYEQVGFVPLDEVIKAPVRADHEMELPLVLTFEEVRRLYDSWAEEAPSRLRRSEVRWAYWKWNLRFCTRLDSGYLCFEGGVVREVVCSKQPRRWEMPAATEWLGLRSLSDRIGIPLGPKHVELELLGYNVPGEVEFFMTDQF